MAWPILKGYHRKVRGSRSAIERRELYRTLRVLGLNCYEARLLRDWRFHAIECFLHCIDDATAVFGPHPSRPFPGGPQGSHNGLPPVKARSERPS